MITARWAPGMIVYRIYTERSAGFSLPEVLIALLLLSLSVSALLRYQQAIAQSFNLQWQKTQMWNALWQRLQGEPLPGWQITLQQQTGPTGCTLKRATTRFHQQEYQLNWLICGEEMR